MQTVLLVVFSLLNLGILGVGIYLTAYLKTKANNLATREEFDELRKQTAELTRVTAQIETEIKGDLWDRQKRWELKRDLLFELAKKTTSVGDALTGLHGVYMTEQRNEREGKEPRLEKRLEIGETWRVAADGYDHASLLASLACPKESVQTFCGFSMMNRKLHEAITGGRAEAFTENVKEWVEKRETVMLAIKNELDLR
jgi:hypothetical protein